MTIRAELRAALEEIMNERQVWQGPEVAPTQSEEQMAGGLVPPNVSLSHAPNNPLLTQVTAAVDPIQLQQQHAQHLHSLRMQEAMQNQMTIQAFSQGIPGAAAPSVSMQHPNFANYQLQNTYNMNPYMSNLIASGMGGKPGMNLAPSQYATSSRLGIFRDVEYEQESRSYGVENLLRDAYTITGQPRSYAAYEDPVEERLSSARRIFRRKESAIADAMSGGAMMAGFLPGVGIAGMVVSQAAAMTIGAGADMYYQRRAETDFIQQLSQDFSTNGTSLGPRGMGYSYAQASGMMSNIRKSAAESPSYTTADYLDILSEGSEQGLFSFNSTPENTSKKIKDVISQIDVFMKLSGDPDVQSAIQRMGQLQTMGLEVSQAQNAMTQMKAFARLAGTSVDNLMANEGAYGAQMAAQTGASAIFGMKVGAFARGSVRVGQQTGAYSERELSAYGGVSGASQSLTQMILNNVQSNVGRNIGAFTKFDSNGNPFVDEGALGDYMDKGVIPGGYKTLVEASSNRVVGGMSDRQQRTFMTQMEKLSRDAMAQIEDPFDQIKFMRRTVAEHMKLNPEMTLDDALYSMEGEKGVLLKQFMSAENVTATAKQISQANLTASEGRKSKFEAEDTMLNNAMTSITKAFENFVGNADFFKERAIKEQEYAMDKAGIPYIRGSDSLPSINQGLLKFGSGDDLVSEQELVNSFIKSERARNTIKEYYNASFLSSDSTMKNEGKKLIEDAKAYRQVQMMEAKGEFTPSLSGQDLRKYVDELAGGGDFNVQAFNNLYKGQGANVAAEVLDAMYKSSDKSVIRSLKDWEYGIQGVGYLDSQAKVDKARDAFTKSVDKYDFSASDLTGLSTFMNNLQEIPEIAGIKDKGAFSSLVSDLAGIGMSGNSSDFAEVLKTHKLDPGLAPTILGMTRSMDVDSESMRRLANSNKRYDRKYGDQSADMISSYIDFNNLVSQANNDLGFQSGGGVFSSEEGRKLHENLRDTAKDLLQQSWGDQFSKLSKEEQELRENAVMNKLGKDRDGVFDANNRDPQRYERSTNAMIREILTVAKKIGESA